MPLLVTPARTLVCHYNPLLMSFDRLLQYSAHPGVVQPYMLALNPRPQRQRSTYLHACSRPVSSTNHEETKNLSFPLSLYLLSFLMPFLHLHFRIACEDCYASYSGIFVTHSWSASHSALLCRVSGHPQNKKDDS